jgi:Lon protease-like protein
MLPITATQFGMNRFLEQRYKEIYGERPQGSARIGVAMAAGSSSALFGCAAEFVMIQQQKSGRSLLAELKHIHSTYGIRSVYKGLVGNLATELVVFW